MYRDKCNLFLCYLKYSHNYTCAQCSYGMFLCGSSHTLLRTVYVYSTRVHSYRMAASFELKEPFTTLLYTGSQDGTVHVWSAETGERITMLDGGHPGPTHCVQFNPKLMMMASSCTSMVSQSACMSSLSAAVVAVRYKVH